MRARPSGSHSSSSAARSAPARSRRREAEHACRSRGRCACGPSKWCHSVVGDIERDRGARGVDPLDAAERRACPACAARRAPAGRELAARRRRGPRARRRARRGRADRRRPCGSCARAAATRALRRRRSARSARIWPASIAGSWCASPIRISGARGGQRVEQRVDELEVDHRRLVDDQRADRQRAARVMREAVAAVAEQAVQRLRDRRRRGEREVDRPPGGGDRGELLGDHLGQPVRGLAGLRGERDRADAPAARARARSPRRRASCRCPARRSTTGERAGERELATRALASFARAERDAPGRAARSATTAATSLAAAAGAAARRSARRSATRTSSRRARSVYRQPSSTISGSRASPAPITESKPGARVSASICLSTCGTSIESSSSATRTMSPTSPRSSRLRPVRAAAGSSPGAARSSARARGCRAPPGPSRRASESAATSSSARYRPSSPRSQRRAPTPSRRNTSSAPSRRRRGRARTARAACRADASGSVMRAKPREPRRPLGELAVVDAHRHVDAVAHEREHQAGEPAVRRAGARAASAYSRSCTP